MCVAYKLTESVWFIVILRAIL